MPPARSQPETERQRERGDERERVPVADRVAQPSHARAVGEQPREHLPQKRPAEHAETERRQQPGRPGRQGRAHERRRRTARGRRKRGTRGRGSGTPTTGRARSTTRSSARSTGRTPRTGRAPTSHVSSAPDGEETRASVANTSTSAASEAPMPIQNRRPSLDPVPEEERHRQQRACDAEDEEPRGRSHRATVAEALAGTHSLQNANYGGQPCRHRPWSRLTSVPAEPSAGICVDSAIDVRTPLIPLRRQLS